MSRARGSPSATRRCAPKTRREDPPIDFEGIATLCANFVTHLFGCPDLPPDSPPKTLPLQPFIAHTLRRTKLTTLVIFTALYLLERMKTRFPFARGASGHRLIISTSLLACKLTQDSAYSNRSWAIVSRDMFPLTEINQMERETLAYLHWDLGIDPAALEEFEARIRRIFSGPGPYTAYSLPGPGVHPYRPLRGPPKAAAAYGIRVMTPAAQPQAAPGPSAGSPLAVASTSPVDMDPSPPFHTGSSTDAMDSTPELSGSMASSPASSAVSPVTPAGYEGPPFPAVGTATGTTSTATASARPQESRSFDVVAGINPALPGSTSTAGFIAHAKECVW